MDRLAHPAADEAYRAWMREHDTLGPEDRRLIRAHAAADLRMERHTDASSIRAGISRSRAASALANPHRAQSPAALSTTS